MSNIVNIHQILVIRNDTTTKWESSKYILDKGELGIGWFSFVDKNGDELNLSSTQAMLEDN